MSATNGQVITIPAIIYRQAKKYVERQADRTNLDPLGIVWVAELLDDDSVLKAEVLLPAGWTTTAKRRDTNFVMDERGVARLRCVYKPDKQGTYVLDVGVTIAERLASELAATPGRLNWHRLTDAERASCRARLAELSNDQAYARRAGHWLEQLQ